VTTPARPEPGSLQELVAGHTPARLFLGGRPGSYPTRTWLQLRADHAAARDAVHSRLDPSDPRLAGLIARHHPVEVSTAVPDDAGYLTRPDLGRRLDPVDRQRLRGLRSDHQLAGSDPPTLAVALAGGLSASAALAHGPAMVDALIEGATDRGWTCAPVLIVHRARVGVLNDLGPATGAEVVVLLVGERPGLVAADTLSAYLGHRPRPGHTDADRNLVSGIHDRGTPVPAAAERVLELVALLRSAGRSGVAVKEAGRRTLP
jgi:ethanolamine ammonia-lyase small subunit